MAIDGLKMSKSLKNFITIGEALKEFTARQLRLLFCLQPWGAPMTFNQASRAEMVQKEATLRNFFLNVQVRVLAGSVNGCFVIMCFLLNVQVRARTGGLSQLAFHVFRWG